MAYKLDNMFAYRFYEKKDGPFITIMKFSENEVKEIGYNVGIVNINEIYNNRRMIENLLYKLFIKAGGKPKLQFPLYAAVYKELPKNNQLHVRFIEPECIKIPMNVFSKDQVSFTYGQSPRAFTRKDNHPTKRKLLLWDEAEKAINQFPYDKNEDTWLEMQIWDDSVIRQFYQEGKGWNIIPFEVKERLSTDERKNLISKYSPFMNLIKPEYFFKPYSAHGVSHAIRTLILSQELADIMSVDKDFKRLLLYCSAYHDIGRANHEIDNNHGYSSYSKIMKLKLLPNDMDEQSKEIIRFIVENHQIDPSIGQNNLKEYQIDNREMAYKVYSILKDADTLDRCRFGNVDKSYLCNSKSKGYVHFAYQLLTIFKETY